MENGKELGSPSQSETESPYDPAIPLLDIYPRELKTLSLHKNLYMSVHSSTIHNIQKVEMTQMSPTDEQINKRGTSTQWYTAIKSNEVLTCVIT